MSSLHENILRDTFQCQDALYHQRNIQTLPKRMDFTSGRLEDWQNCRDLANQYGGKEESVPGFVRSKCREAERLHQEVERLQAMIAALQAAKPDADQAADIVPEQFRGVHKRIDIMATKILNELTSLRAKVESGIQLKIVAE